MLDADAMADFNAKKKAAAEEEELCQLQLCNWR
jgi:hypothetical protein